MVRSVEEDARGIVAPDVGLERFRLERYAPSPRVGRLVDRFWTVRWDLGPGEVFEQPVWTHPVTNVVFEDGIGRASGVLTRMFTRVIQKRGHVLGVMFRPAGFRPLWGAPMRLLRDRTVPFGDVVGQQATVLAHALAATAYDEEEAAVARVDQYLATLIPGARHPAEDTAELAEAAAVDPSIVRVEQLADLAGVSPRTLQRRFSDHVGISPKALIRRYRLYEAAEAVRHGPVDWAALAARLGYADQSHLTRDFRDALGVPPAAYARANQPDD